MTEIDRYNEFINTALPALSQPAPAPRRSLDLKHWAQEFADVYRVSEALSKTPFVPKEMMGKTADVAAAIMRGRELGLDPFDALGSVYVVHGRVGYYAEFMRRRIIQAGHKLRIVESTDSRCIVEGTRLGESDAQRATFTAEQAKKAGINLGNYPADKLLARATSRLCRQVFPDVLAGSVIAEDLMDGLIPTTDTTEAAPEAPPATAAIQRKRPTKPAQAAATQPPDAPKKAAQPDPEVDELLDDDKPEATPAEVPEAQGEQIPLPPEPVVDDTDELLDDAVDAEPVDLITPAQLKKLAILLRQAGFDTTETKHGFVCTAINREIGSSKELTKDEATKVIGILENGA